jgi:hypothetical protein
MMVEIWAQHTTMLTMNFRQPSHEFGGIYKDGGGGIYHDDSDLILWVQ